MHRNNTGASRKRVRRAPAGSGRTPRHLDDPAADPQFEAILQKAPIVFWTAAFDRLDHLLTG